MDSRADYRGYRKMSVIPLEHQIRFSELVFSKLKSTGYVYLAGEPRSGKTYTAILACERSNKIRNVLILTTIEAKKGWYKFTVNNSLLKHTYHIHHYEEVGRVLNKKVVLKLRKGYYDLVIIDESHNIGAFPKPTQRYLTIRALCYDMPHIHLSGTAIAESPCSIYHQMSISKYNPFKQFSSFYRFHDEYGQKYNIRIPVGSVPQYDRAKPSLMTIIDSFTIYMTQEDAGISKSTQAVDKIHYVELSQEVKDLYNYLQEHQVHWVANGMFNNSNTLLDKRDLVCDSEMKLRVSLHMLESGVAKVDDEYLLLGNTEKIDYIYNTFGDTKGVGIMCHFKAERMLLATKFKNAAIYSSTTHAEGVDLSHLEHFVIMSSDYRGAKFIQRRERIINTNGSVSTTVHHILVKKAISSQVYSKVSKKRDFNNSTYVRNRV